MSDFFASVGAALFLILIYAAIVVVIALVISFPLLWLAPGTGLAALAALGYWNWFTICIMSGLLGIAGRLFTNNK